MEIGVIDSFLVSRTVLTLRFDKTRSARALFYLSALSGDALLLNYI